MWLPTVAALNTLLWWIHTDAPIVFDVNIKVKVK